MKKSENKANGPACPLSVASFDAHESSQNYSDNMSRSNKAVFLGDKLVGKSSIFDRLLDVPFQPSYEPTYHIDTRKRIISLGEVSTYVELWDCGADLDAHTASVLKECGVKVLVYDVTRRASFDHLSHWLSAAGSGLVILVGTKIDLRRERQVLFAEGASRAQALDASFIELSAKTDENIGTLRLLLARLAFKPLYRLCCLADCSDSFINCFLYTKLQCGRSELTNFATAMAAAHVSDRIRLWDASTRGRCGCARAAALVAVDVSAQNSLSDIGKRMKLARDELGPCAVVLAVGYYPKLDQREVARRNTSFEEVAQVSSAAGAIYTELSSTDGPNVTRLLQLLEMCCDAVGAR